MRRTSACEPSVTREAQTRCACSSSRRLAGWSRPSHCSPPPASSHHSRPKDWSPAVYGRGLRGGAAVPGTAAHFSCMPHGRQRRCVFGCLERLCCGVGHEEGVKRRRQARRRRRGLGCSTARGPWRAAGRMRAPAVEGGDPAARGCVRGVRRAGQVCTGRRAVPQVPAGSTGLPPADQRRLPLRLRLRLRAALPRLGAHPAGPQTPPRPGRRRRTA